MVIESRGAKRAFKELISESAWLERAKAMRVPDWNYFLLKLEARIPDEGWQQILNRTKLGINQVMRTILFLLL